MQAEGWYRTSAENLGKFYVSNTGGDGSTEHADRRRGAQWPGIHHEVQPVSMCADQRGAAPGYSSAQAIAALEDVFKKTMPPEMGFDYMGMSYQEVKAAQGVSPTGIFGLSFLIVFLIMAAQYESWTLPLSVLLGVPIAVFGAFLPFICAGSTTMFTRRSAWSC